MASCGRLALGLLELLLHRNAGRLTIGRRMPSCPTSAHADSPSIPECPETSGDQSVDAAGQGPAPRRAGPNRAIVDGVSGRIPMQGRGAAWFDGLTTDTGLRELPCVRYSA